MSSTSNAGLVVGVVLIIGFLCVVLLPAINDVGDNGGGGGEEPAEGGYNAGSAGIPLARYNDTTLPNTPINYNMTISLTESASAGKMLKVEMTAPSQHTYTVRAVDQQVVFSNDFSIFVKGGYLFVHDAEGYRAVDILTVSATVSTSGIRAVINGQAYSDLTELYTPDHDGKYASYHTFEYEYGEPIATGLWSYGKHVFGVQSHGLTMDGETYNLTASYKDGFSGNGVQYRR